MNYLKEYRKSIVAAGFLLGIASQFSILPQPEALGKLSEVVYAALIALAGYVWYKEYHSRAMKANALMKKGFHKTPYYEGPPKPRPEQPTTPVVKKKAPTGLLEQFDR